MTQPSTVSEGSLLHRILTHAYAPLWACWSRRFLSFFYVSSSFPPRGRAESPRLFLRDSPQGPNSFFQNAFRVPLGHAQNS